MQPEFLILTFWNFFEKVFGSIKRIYMTNALAMTAYLYIWSYVPKLFTLAASMLYINYLIRNVLSET